MAQQKYKSSKARVRRRRAHFLRLEKPNLVPCPNCKSLKLPHRVCPECGFYNGKQVVFKKIKEKKESKPAR